MGPGAGVPRDARHGARPHRGHDRGAAPHARRVAGALLIWLAALAAAAPAQDLRVATFHAELARDGPGLLLRDAVRGHADVADAAARIAAARPDVIAVQGLDWDAEGRTLEAFADAVAAAGHALPHRLALRPNRGVPLDPARPRGPQHGWARFAGQGGMALLSRHPLGPPTDLTALLWRDLPGARRRGADGTDLLAGEWSGLRLSTTGHWAVPVETPSGGVTILMHHATPPVFDGPEDRNGRRAADEAALWARLLDGGLADVPGGAPAPAGAVVLLVLANVDPADGDGLPEGIDELLSHPRLTDPRPRGGGADVADADHAGDPGLDTADFDDPPGNLRASYVLPSRDLSVRAAGVAWPREGASSRHGLVWVDLALPP